jgi:hypothetical protein
MLDIRPVVSIFLCCVDVKQGGSQEIHLVLQILSQPGHSRLSVSASAAINHTWNGHDGVRLCMDALVITEMSSM